MTAVDDPRAGSALWRRAATRLAAVPGYQPGAAAPSETGKLSSNESPLGASPRVIEALSEALHRVHRYPEEDTVRGKVAARVGVTDLNVVLTNGSDELCSLLATVFVEPGDTVVSSDPAYGIDTKVSVLAGATLRLVPLHQGAHDLESLTAASVGARLLWLPSPHNPTGSAVSLTALDRLLDRIDPSCLVVLDEAYRAYLDPSQRPDAPALLARHPNLVVQRTFSKDQALAGLRLGYGVAAPPIVSLLSRVRAPFSVNALALVAAGAALEDRAWEQMAVAQVVAERERLQVFLDSLSVEYIPSQANFVTARIPHHLLAPHLAAEQLTVRPGESLGMPGWVRISIGTPQTMARLRRQLTLMSQSAQHVSSPTHHRRTTRSPR